MKNLDKKNMMISERNKGQYDFEYSEEIIFNSERFDNMEIMNLHTRERRPYKELNLNVDNKGNLYFYPPEMFGSSKAVKEYAVTNWVFVDDVRNKESLNADFKDGVVNWMQNATDTMYKLGVIASEAGRLISSTTEAMNNAMVALNNGQYKGLPQEVNVVENIYNNTNQPQQQFTKTPINK